MRTYLTADVRRAIGISSKSGLHDYLARHADLRAAIVRDEVGLRGSRIWIADLVDEHVRTRLLKPAAAHLGRFAEKGAPPPSMRKKSD
jgi:hypothetical protein